MAISIVKKVVGTLGLSLLAATGYICLWPVPAAPVSWAAPKALGFTGPYAPNNRLAALRKIDIGNEVGPEHIALGPDGRLYAAMTSGNLLRMDPDGRNQEIFANTGGRVLGFAFEKDRFGDRRRAKKSSRAEMRDAFSFGPFSLFPVERILRKDGTAVPVGDRAFDMLVAFVQRNGTVVTTEELMAIAWPEVIVVDSNVRVQVANLRRTLGCGRDGARYIANVAGRGYCFVEPVRPVDSLDSSSRTSSESNAAQSEGNKPTAGSLSTFPAPLESAIGRDACVAELAQVVKERRVVTVVGAAGAGKTTLATLVAHAMDGFEDCMCFVDLSVVDRDEMVTEALASAVGYMPSGADLLPGLLEVLSARRALIVLDNCEHVISAAASLCQQIVHGTRQVFLLNTSREALRVREEFVYLLRPLAFPPHAERLTTKQAMTWPAIQLFMERAAEGGARGIMSDDEAGIVAALCRRLDGNPHAIGLVASRVGELWHPGCC